MKRYLRWLLIAALVMGYPVLMHYTNVANTPGDGGAGSDNALHARRLGALVATAPIVLLAGLWAWRCSWRYVMLAAVALMCTGLWAVWPFLLQHYGAVYWLQHVGMQLVCAFVFGRTLLEGEVPLCTQFARIVHQQNPMAPEREQYARQVTIAWMLFFIVIAIISTLLFFLTSLATWSTFSNLVTLPLAILMFVVEYCIRVRVFPHVKAAPILDGIRAYMNRGVNSGIKNSRDDNNR